MSERLKDCRFGLLIGIGGGAPAVGSLGRGASAGISGGGCAVPGWLGFTLVIAVAVEYRDAMELASSSPS